MSRQIKVTVTGAGGFIGHHLCKCLVEHGYWVRGVDIKEPEYERTAADEFELLDLTKRENCLKATRGVQQVYGLAANMGGIGFIETHKAEIVRDNTLINLQSIEAARINGVQRYLYTSSACIYPGYKQKSPDVTPLKEEDAYPADAEDGYGWEKLYMERNCRHYSEDFGIETRVVRFHSIFGPLGTYDGGREKSPAASWPRKGASRSDPVRQIAAAAAVLPLLPPRRRGQRSPLRRPGGRTAATRLAGDGADQQPILPQARPDLRRPRDLERHRDPPGV